MFRKIIKGLKDVWCGTLEFDTEPKKDSFNPVTSGGVYDAINGAGGAKEIVYFDVDPSDPPSGIYEAIGEALSNNKLPAIRSDGKLYLYTSTGTDVYNFVGVFSTDGVGYEEFSVYTDDNVQVDEHTASLGYAALPSSGTEEHPAWAKVCELEPKPQQTYTTYGLALLFTAEHPSNDGKNTESGIIAIDVGSNWFTNSNCCNASWMAYTPGSEYSKILGVKIIGKYGVPSNPALAPYPVYKIEVWVKYYGGHNILVNALQNAMYFTGMVQANFFNFPEGHAAVPQSTEPSYSDTEEYVYKNFFYPAQSPSVAYTHAQSLTSEQKAQGRDNIGAASASDVTALQSQVSSLSNVSAYSVKGEATVAQLNAGPSGIQAGWAYQLTDSGTLTDGSLAVVAGDTVAWDGTKWFPLVKSDYYATKTYAQNVAHSIAPEFDPEKTGGYIFGEIFADGGKTYLTIDDFSGAFDASKVLNVNGTFIDFFSSFVTYFRKNGLGQNGELRTRVYGNITFYLVPIPAGTHVSIKKTYSSMSAPAADFVRYNSDKSVKSYVNAKSIDYTTTDDEYLSFAFQPADKFPVFVIPTSLHTDVIGALNLYETKAVADFLLDDRWKIHNGYLDADGNIGYSTADYGWECSYKIPMPRGARISITKSAALSSSWKDFVAYDSDGEVLASANDTSFSYEFADDGFLSFVRLPSGTFTIKANKVLETFASFYRQKEINIKSLSIISSSSSTYYGFIPSGQITYYGPIAAAGQVDLPNGVKDTWWHKVCSQLGIPLLLNDSASGSYYTTAGGIGTPQITRLENVYGAGTVGSVRPDLLIFYTCINDSYDGVEVGLPKYSDWDESDKAKIAPALCYGMDLIQKYCPGVKILNIMNFTLNMDIRAAMIAICEHYGVKNILLPTCERTNGHPTARGMTQISEFVKRAIVDML